MFRFVVPCLACVLWLAPAQAAEGDALAGVWTLDGAKSSNASGPLPKNETRTYGIAKSDGSLTLVVEGVAAEGTPYAYGATGEINGMEYPIPGRDEGARILGDSISWRRVDPLTVEMDIKKKGGIINATRHALSEDGRTLTVTEDGIDPEGKPIHASKVYRRR